MKRFHFSKWINSSGGPLVAFEEKYAHMWSGIDGNPSDYDLSCQVDGYAGKIIAHSSEVLVLGDEPLQTLIASKNNFFLIIRCIWGDSEKDIFEAVGKVEFSEIDCIDSMDITWKDKKIVLFDAADKFSTEDHIAFLPLSNHNNISTFMFRPNKRISLLIHRIAPLFT